MSAERCQSGRSGRFRKPVCLCGYRGFESHPLRQIDPDDPLDSIADRGVLELLRIPVKMTAQNKDASGEVSEWLKEHAWKACVR